MGPGKLQQWEAMMKTLSIVAITAFAFLGLANFASAQGGFQVSSMKTVDLVNTCNGQTVPLPEEFRFDTPRVSIRREGEAVNQAKG